MAAGAAVVPRPRPGVRPETALPARPPLRDGIQDMRRAVPAKDVRDLPPTAEQYRDLQEKIGQARPQLNQAQAASRVLVQEADRLQRQLVDTAGRVQALEGEALSLTADIARLTTEEARLSKEFARDRVRTLRLLAVLERLQHSLPPALALKPKDALAAARSAMLMGAGLPRIYRAAADLAGKIDALRQTRRSLIDKRESAARNAKQLTAARGDLTRLLAVKRVEADAAKGRYGALKAEMDLVAVKAADLAALMKRIATLRAMPDAAGVVAVTAEGEGGRPGRLLRPLAGRSRTGGIDGVGGADAPGLTFVGVPGAAVVAPADGEVRFAGDYHNSGRLLILRIADGYDAVLAGLERLDVRLGDRVLAGEPVGRMAGGETRGRGLYFELRHDGRGVNPAPFLAETVRKAR